VIHPEQFGGGSIVPVPEDPVLRMKMDRRIRAAAWRNVTHVRDDGADEGLRTAVMLAARR